MPTLATRISDLATAIATAIKSKADKTAVVDLTTNQSVAGKKSFTQEIALANLASDPSSLSAGMAWLNSTEGAVKMYIGGQIVTLYRLTVGDPSALSDGLIWYDLLDNKLRLRRDGVTREISDSSHTHAFSDLTGKPTTLAGYAILDAVASGTAGLKLTVGSTAPVAPAVNDIWIDPASSAISFADLIDKPMTLAGYGIPEVTWTLPGTPAISGTWAHLGEGRGALGARAESGGVMRMRPYTARCTGTITSVAVGVNNAIAGSLAKVAFYESVNGRATTLIAESADIDCSATGLRSASIAAVPQVEGTQYFVAVRVSGNQGLNTDVNSPRLDGTVGPANWVPSCVSRNVAYATAAPPTWGWNNSEYTANREPWFVMGGFA